MTKNLKIVDGEIDLTRVRGLLFDVDGTLSDTDDHMVDRITQSLLPISWLYKNKDPRKFARWLVVAIEMPANFIYSLTGILGINLPLSDFYHWLSHHRRKNNSAGDRFWIIPGVKELLEELNKHYPLAVVSARDAASTAHFLEHFDLMQYFRVIVTAQTCEYTKPFPDPVLFAADQLGIEPEACVMIGDTIVDVLAGKSAGAQTVAVLCGFGTQGELKRAGADLILSITPDLIQILLS